MINYSVKKGAEKGIESAIIFTISFILANWDSLTSQIPSNIKFVLGMSLAAVIKMALNFIKQWLISRK